MTNKTLKLAYFAYLPSLSTQKRQIMTVNKLEAWRMAQNYLSFLKGIVIHAKRLLAMFWTEAAVVYEGDPGQYERAADVSRYVRGLVNHDKT